MNKKIIIVAVVIALAVVAGLWYKNFYKIEEVKPAVSATGKSDVKSSAEAPMNIGATRELVVIAKNFSFSPNEIAVKKGERVKITFKNTEGFHALKIEAFGVETKQIGAGMEEVVEFTADKTGTFEYHCTVGRHREMGMVGVLKVE